MSLISFSCLNRRLIEKYEVTDKIFQDSSTSYIIQQIIEIMVKDYSQEQDKIPLADDQI